jgi:DNA-binding response OmpR family regulator
MTTRGHILYCEDHEDTRVIMTIMLKRAGFQVTTARTGSECLKLARRSGQPFDLYLLDNTIPDMSGVSICRELRQSDAKTPILFYSARAMPDEKEEAMKAGAQDYLIKPNDLFDVASHVERWIVAARREC